LPIVPRVVKEQAYRLDTQTGCRRPGVETRRGVSITEEDETLPVYHRQQHYTQ